jgi:hypothetical protein
MFLCYKRKNKFFKAVLNSLPDQIFSIVTRVLGFVSNIMIMTFSEILIGGIGLKNHFAFLIDIDARDVETGRLINN